jgi:uncharacterized membrane protein YqjE
MTTDDETFSGPRHQTDDYASGAFREDGSRRARGPVSRAKDEAATVGTLIRQLADDLVGLLQDEVALAKLEVRREMRGLGGDLAKMGIAVGFGLLAAQALTAFLILGLGVLIGSFWGSALIVGLLFLVIAVILGKTTVSKLRARNPVPEATLQTIREDARWAQQEAQEFKRELRK